MDLDGTPGGIRRFATREPRSLPPTLSFEEFGMIVRAASPASQSLLAELPSSVSPQIGRRSCETEVSAGFVDVSAPILVLEDPLHAMNFSWIVGHLDLLGHHLG